MRQIFLPVAALFQVAGSSLPQIYGWGVSIGERSRALDTAIIPAGWAFSIWGIIFLWAILFALFSASRSENNATLVDRVAWPAIGAFTMNGIWGLYVPFFGLNLVSELIIVIGLICAIAAALIAGRFSAKTFANQFFVAAPLGLLAGWLTMASFVGASSIMVGLGIEMTNTVLLLIVTVAAGFAGFVAFLRPSPAYLFAVVWALAAIISKNVSSGNQMVLLTAAAATLLLLLISIVRWR